MLRKIRKHVTVPVVAIGGITRENVSEVIAAGADGVAVISAVVGTADITGAAREIKRLVTESKRRCGRGGHP
jgi:thiamine-phosphate pyrophosphorylase